MRPIDADALVEAVKDYPYGFRGMIVCDIAKQPTIDPVRHGKWSHERMLSTSGGTYAVIRCSECMSQYPMWETNYCPNCGAKMDGGDEYETD